MWKNMDKLKHIYGLSREEEYLALRESKRHLAELFVKDIFETSFEWGKYLDKDANDLENSNVFKKWVEVMVGLMR